MEALMLGVPYLNVPPPARPEARRFPGAQFATVFLVLLAVGCGSGGGGSGDGQPDYTRAGSTGNRPFGESQPETDLSVQKPIPFEPPCDVQYEYLVRLRDPVTSCTGYDFRPLYSRAESLAEFRTFAIRCQNGCQRIWRVVDHAWFCDDGFAVVLLNVVVMCCSPTGPALPPAVTAPPPGPLLVERRPPVPNPAEHEEHSFQTRTQVMACGSRELHTFNYFAAVPSCASLASYWPFVQQALLWVQFLELLGGCSQPCGNDSELLRWEWSCSGNLVHVRVYFVKICG
jgi:hypothetical protein